MADSSGTTVRVISRDLPDGGRIIIALDGSAEPADDEAILDRSEADMRQRRLRVVDDPE